MCKKHKKHNSSTKPYNKQVLFMTKQLQELAYPPSSSFLIAAFYYDVYLFCDIGVSTINIESYSYLNFQVNFCQGLYLPNYPFVTMGCHFEINTFTSYRTNYNTMRQSPKI